MKPLHRPRRLLSVAPMMAYTDRHFRRSLRQLSRRTLLYSEMLTTGAILHGDSERLLGFDDIERPLALQLGGDDPDALARCARRAADLGYDEINLNAGCPSERVQRGRFGACLMAHPGLVADCVASMRAAVGVPVTVKHRIGIDRLDRYEDLARFVETVARAGCDAFIIHARVARLEAGLSPKANRTKTPLRREEVYRLKDEHPRIEIEINGDIVDLDGVEEQLSHVDGAMIGRAAIKDPFLFAAADRRIFGEDAPPPTRREVVEGMIPYLRSQLELGVPPHRITRHLLGLFARQRGNRAWRRALSDEESRACPPEEILPRALAKLPPEVLDSRV